MWIAKTKQQLKENLRDTSGPVILVPTMGALHQGHTSLIDAARQKAGPDGTVLVSIFVNPIQFDRESDLAKYPRPLESDIAACKAHGANGVFAPYDGEVYAEDRSITVLETELSRYLCGATRPGHFDGVCTIVLKLFNLTKCDAAIFGEKDFQQLAIVRRMVRDLDLETEILTHPTIRETDGLAMSSRNRRLTAEHRADAARICLALSSAARQTAIGKILGTAERVLSESDFVKIDYLSLVDAESLAPATNLDRPTVLACAVFYGDVRLIDHIDIPAR
ncbi:pantoate--beta-alanine ligase [Luteolibacter sp. AS25]|uniref:pantoate--beta-alanine ligase n=1 Tax=Luteolibacter sp. AS25 TaxID=3135776 RepID=UPI00398B9BD0